MKKLLMLCITIIMCIGITGCSNKTTMEKIDELSITEKFDDNIGFEVDEYDFILNYNNDNYTDSEQLLIQMFDGNLQEWFSYIPSENIFVFDIEYEDEDSVIMTYSIDNDMFTLQNYEECDFSGCYSGSDCANDVANYIVDEKKYESAKSMYDKLLETLEEHDITLEELCVPYEDLDK